MWIKAAESCLFPSMVRAFWAYQLLFTIDQIEIGLTEWVLSQSTSGFQHRKARNDVVDASVLFWIRPETQDYAGAVCCLVSSWSSFRIRFCGWRSIEWVHARSLTWCVNVCEWPTVVVHCSVSGNWLVLRGTQQRTRDTKCGVFVVFCVCCRKGSNDGKRLL